MALNSKAASSTNDRDLAKLRTERMRHAVLWSMIAKLARVGSQSVIVGLTVRHLGATPYGAWLAAVASLGWLSWGQAGLAPSLANALGAAEGDGRTIDQGVYLTTAFTLVSFITVALYVAGRLLVAWAGWPAINLPDAAAASVPLRREWNAFLNAAFILALLRLPLGVVESAFIGLQRVHLLRVFDIAGQLCAVCTAAALFLIKTPPSQFVLTVGISAECGVVAAAFYLVFIAQPQLRPAFNKIDLAKCRDMFSLSGGYLVTAITGYVLTSGAIVILTWLKGPVAVPVFALTWQLYQMVAGFWMMFVTGIWGALAQAKARGDLEWLKRTQRHLVWGSTACAAVFAVGLVVFGDVVLNFWSGGRIRAEASFLFAMAMYVVAFTWSDVHALMLNAIDLVWRQVAVSVANAVLMLLLAVLLVPIYGTTGLVIALAGSCIATKAWALPYVLAKAMKSATDGSVCSGR